MKKLVVGLLCAAMIVGTLTGCGEQKKAETTKTVEQSSENKNDEKLASLESKLADLESENESLQAIVNGQNSVADNSTQPALPNTPQQIVLNTPFTCDGIFEMTVTSAEWTDEIYPSNTSGGYSYYQDKNGESFFVLKGTIKNISGDLIDVQFCSYSEMLFNGTYKYSPEWTAESQEGDDFYGYQINPLQSSNFVIYASVPDEVKENFQSCKVSFGFSDLTHYVYKWEDCTHIYEITVQ